MSTEAPAMPPAWLTITLAAVHSSLSEGTIRRLLERGRLTPHRPTPGRILISREELDNVVRSSANGRSKRKK